MEKKEEVLNVLKEITYPGFSKDIVTLGAVQDVEATPDAVVIGLKNISADEKVLNDLTEEIKSKVAPIVGNAEIHVMHGATQTGGSCGTPGPHDESPFKKNRLPGVKRIIPVISGKGGVGKSTVSVNLASTLARKGFKVGLLDLDIFGPSIHRMLDVKMRLTAEENIIVPAQAHGMKVISIGMAVDDDEALVLRGPMVMKLLNQLINQVGWGDLDYLIVDMPPGTGDVPLSLTQQLAITGAIVVTTPQDISLIDVRRGVAMLKQVEARILGVVENMSHYICEKCGDEAHIFGHGGGKKEAEKIGVPLLAQVPLTKSICEAGDAGKPIVDPETQPELAKVFDQLADNLIKGCDEIPSESNSQDAVQSSGG